jgi:hypothetical protein
MFLVLFCDLSDLPLTMMLWFDPENPKNTVLYTILYSWLELFQHCSLLGTNGEKGIFLRIMVKQQ